MNAARMIFSANMSVPTPVWWLTCAVGLWSLSTPNPGLSLMGCLLLPFFCIMFWRRGEPPVLLFALIFQWLQVYMTLIIANNDGIDLGQGSADHAIRDAIGLSFVGLVLLAVGMLVGLGAKTNALGFMADKEAEFSKLTSQNLLWIYSLSHVFAIGTGIVGSVAVGLAQPMLALGLLRWAVVFMVFWMGSRHDRFRTLAFGIFVFEIVLGFMGYFSEFKTVLFIAVVVGLSIPNEAERGPRSYWQLVLLTVVALSVALFWQSVKADYRQFLNQGTSMQEVSMPVSDRISFLADRFLTFDESDLVRAARTGAERLAYLELFARVTEYVPDSVSYQDGRLLGETLSHIFLPRLLFPDKAVVDDNKLVVEYTGIILSGTTEGTSISLGYMAESYIDFGPEFMFVQIFLLGVFWGSAYRILMKTGPSRFLALSVATSLILLNAASFDGSATKIFGGGVTGLIVSWIVLRLYK